MNSTMMGTMMEGVEHEKTPRLSRFSNTFSLIEHALQWEWDRMEQSGNYDGTHFKCDYVRWKLNITRRMSAYVRYDYHVK
jgi:hypothetical protein